MNKLRKPKRTNPALMASVGRHLKEVRMDRDLTQEYVNEHTELNISRLESGKVNISLVSLSILCNLYNISLQEFFAGIIKEE